VGASVVVVSSTVVVVSSAVVVVSSTVVVVSSIVVEVVGTLSTTWIVTLKVFSASPRGLT
jgi:hypothetical protein